MLQPRSIPIRRRFSFSAPPLRPRVIQGTSKVPARRLTRREAYKVLTGSSPGKQFLPLLPPCFFSFFPWHHRAPGAPPCTRRPRAVPTQFTASRQHPTVEATRREHLTPRRPKSLLQVRNGQNSREHVHQRPAVQSSGTFTEALPSPLESRPPPRGWRLSEHLQKPPSPPQLTEPRPLIPLIPTFRNPVPPLSPHTVRSAQRAHVSGLPTFSPQNMPLPATTAVSSPL